MVAALRGNVLAFGLFAAFFALHIVGGATDQGWLFAIAVALIAATAVGFPWLAAKFGRAAAASDRKLTVALGAVIGAALTAGVFWAANDRSWAIWHVPAAAAIALAVAAFTLQGGAAAFRRGRGSPARG
jgi:uncharacterized membrane protein YeaQ/YmgE (transglycosylase-associated protein family)